MYLSNRSNRLSRPRFQECSDEDLRRRDNEEALAAPDRPRFSHKCHEPFDDSKSIKCLKSHETVDLLNVERGCGTRGTFRGY